jgi:hypothetical protein
MYLCLICGPVFSLRCLVWGLSEAPRAAAVIGGKTAAICGRDRGGAGIGGLDAHVFSLISSFKVNDAIAAIMDLVGKLNKYIEAQAPWKLAKTDLPAAERVLATAAFGLLTSARLLKPVMPTKCQQVIDVLSSPDGKIQPHPALFPRIEVEKK